MVLEKAYQKRVYPRQKALREKDLIDVTNIAENNGFLVPVAITNSLDRILKHNIPVLTKKNRMEYDDFSLEALNQDYEGRLNDLLWMTHLERCKDKNRRKKIFSFTMFLPHFKIVKSKTGRKTKKLFTKATLKCVRGHGDHGEFVITIMLPEEECKWESRKE